MKNTKDKSIWSAIGTFITEIIPGWHLDFGEESKDKKKRGKEEIAKGFGNNNEKEPKMKVVQPVSSVNNNGNVPKTVDDVIPTSINLDVPLKPIATKAKSTPNSRKRKFDPIEHSTLVKPIPKRVIKEHAPQFSVEKAKKVLEKYDNFPSPMEQLNTKPLAVRLNIVRRKMEMEKEKEQEQEFEQAVPTPVDHKTAFERKLELNDSILHRKAKRFEEKIEIPKQSENGGVKDREISKSENGKSKVSIGKDVKVVTSFTDAYVNNKIQNLEQRVEIVEKKQEENQKMWLQFQKDFEMEKEREKEKRIQKEEKRKQERRIQEEETRKIHEEKRKKDEEKRKQEEEEKRIQEKRKQEERKIQEEEIRRQEEKRKQQKEEKERDEKRKKEENEKRKQEEKERDEKKRKEKEEEKRKQEEKRIQESKINSETPISTKVNEIIKPVERSPMDEDKDEPQNVKPVQTRTESLFFTPTNVDNHGFVSSNIGPTFNSTQGFNAPPLSDNNFNITPRKPIKGRRANQRN